MGFIIVLAAPVFFLAIALEWWWGWRASQRGQLHLQTYRLDDAINSISLGVISQLSAVFMGGRGVTSLGALHTPQRPGQSLGRGRFHGIHGVRQLVGHRPFCQSATVCRFVDAVHLLCGTGIDRCGCVAVHATAACVGRQTTASVQPVQKHLSHSGDQTLWPHIRPGMRMRGVGMGVTLEGFIEIVR